MGFNRFLFSLILIVLMIFLTGIGLSFLWASEDRLFTQVFFLLLLALEAFWLYQLVSRTNRDLLRFMISFDENDLSGPINRGHAGKMFNGLYEAFENIQTKLFTIRASREKEYQLYQIILDKTGSGLMLLNSEGVIEMSNPAAIRLLGIGPIKDLNYLDQIIPGSKEFLSSQARNYSKTWNFIRDGQEVELLIQSIPIKMDEADYSIISIQDIKKQLSENAMRSQKNIIRILSHEINNTLTPITTLTDALIRNSESSKSMLKNRDDLIEGLEIIQDRSNSILDFVNSYRERSHIPDPVKQWLVLSELINEVLVLNQALINEQQIRVKNLTIKDHCIRILGDKKLLGQVLQNLLINSIEVLQHQIERVIEFSVETLYSGDFLLKICDNGPGIAPEIREKLFTPFFSTKKDGNGIGLCLSQQIMNLHDGEIEIKTLTTTGTEISLLFRSHNVCINSEQDHDEIA